MSLVTSTPTGKRPDPLTARFYLPRLPKEHYQGDAVVFWTLTTFDRAEVWLRNFLLALPPCGLIKKVRDSLRRHLQS